jgi:hypothetical protein
MLVILLDSADWPCSNVEDGFLLKTPLTPCPDIHRLVLRD